MSEADRSDDDLPVAGPSSGSTDLKPKKKRTRLSCACVRCRKKKIKCDEATPRCGPCVSANVDCIVTPPSEKSRVAPIRQKTGLGQANKAATPNIASLPYPHNLGAAGTPSDSRGPFPVAYNTAHTFTAIGTSGSTDNQTMFNQAQLAHVGASQLQRATQLDYTQPPPPPGTVQRTVTFAVSPSVTSPATSKGAPLTPDTDISASHPRLSDPGLVHDVDPNKRKFVGASSSQIFLKWLDAESHGKPLTPYLRHGVSSSDEFDYAGDDLLRYPLPPPEELKVYLDRYFYTAHLAMPFIDEPALRELAFNPEKLAKDPISRVVLFLVICIGNDVGLTPQVNFSQDGSRYLDAAWHGLPLVMSRPFKSSVQALMLFSIALRNRNKDGNAYLHCGTAVRMAQSLGLHLSCSRDATDLDSRIFWSCYCLEKQLAFETGRPCAINDLDCSVPLPIVPEELLLARPGYPRLNPFLASIGLCQELSLISARLFSRMATTMTPVEALQWIGECDARLQRWAESLPLDLQPGIDGAPDNGVLPFAARIACPYYLALMTLHRLSLFDEGTLITPHLSDPSLKPYLGRLRASGSICAQAARAVLTTFERLAHQFPADKMWTVHIVLSAILVLSLRIWRNPTSMSSRADLQFIRSATEFAVQKYREFRYNESFIALLPKLYEKIAFKVENPSLPSRPGSRQSSPQAGESSTSATANGGPTASSSASSANEQMSIADMISVAQSYPVSAATAGTASNGHSSTIAQAFDNANNGFGGPAYDFGLWPVLVGDGNELDSFFHLFAGSDGRNEAENASSALTPGGAAQTPAFAFDSTS